MTMDQGTKAALASFDSSQRDLDFSVEVKDLLPSLELTESQASQESKVELTLPEPLYEFLKTNMKTSSSKSET